MSDRWLHGALAESQLGASRTFPRDVISDALRTLPVTAVFLSGLSTEAVRRWLSDRGIHHHVTEYDRLLRGCLVARAGAGVVFLDGSDSEEERRFTFAHEIAHFVLDYLLPRRRALNAFGDQILPVVDGQRAATKEEALSAVLDRVPLGVHVQLMNRSSVGVICTWEVEDAEQRADRLALELLAPAETVLLQLRGKVLSEDDGDQIDEIAASVAARFGIPSAAARTYTKMLLVLRRRIGSPTLKALGIER